MGAVGGAGEVASRRQWRLVFAATGLSSWVTTATLSTVNVGLTDIQQSFDGYSLRTIGWVITAFNVVHAALLLPAGRLADRYGRYRVYNVGLIMFGIGSLAAALAPTFPLLIAGRVLQGAGGAIFGPASLGLLLEITDAGQRVRAIALFSACTTLGGTSGPTLGAVIIDKASWRWALLLPALVTVAVWLAGRAHLPRTGGDGSTSRLDYTGTAIATAAMAAIVLAVGEGRAWGWTSPTVLTLLVASFIGILLVVRRIRNEPEPIIPRALFASRSFSVGIAATLSMGIIGGSVQLCNILFLRSVWGYDALGAGLGVTPAPLFASLASPYSARLGARFGERAVALPALAGFFASILWFATRLGPEPQYWTHFFPASAVQGVMVAFTFPMIQAVTVRDTPGAQLSVASAASRALSQVGQAVGVAAVLALIGAGAGLTAFRHAWTFHLASLAVSAAAVATLGTRRQAARPSITHPR